MDAESEGERTKERERKRESERERARGALTHDSHGATRVAVRVSIAFDAWAFRWEEGFLGEM